MGDCKGNGCEMDGDNQAASVLLYNNNGQLVSAEIVVDSLGENIIAVPINTGVTTKKVLRNVENVRVVEVAGPSTKPTKAIPIITGRQIQPPSATIVTAVTTIHTTVTTTTTASATTKTPAQVKPRQKVVTNALAKSFISTDLPVKLNSKTDSGCTKILITSDVESKSQQLSTFNDEELSELSPIGRKTSHSNGGEGDDGTTTVMMRINSLGNVELDPVFVTADALTLDTHQVGVNKAEPLNMEVQVDLQTPAASQAEVGNGSINQNWFTSREDKEMLRWRGHAWRQGMWSREETELLQHNIQEYCSQQGIHDPAALIFKMSKEERSGFYRVIARGLNRPLFSVYRRVIRLYDNHNHIGKYTTEEVRKLRELRMKHGNNWQAIAAHLGRSAASVKDRCRLLNEHCNRGAWTTDEEERLSAAVYELAQVLPGEQVTSGISWGEVSGRVRTRSEKQCRTKWLNYLNWKRTSGVEWSKADDTQLICRLSVCGVREESQVDWIALGRAWPACRSPHWLRGKWWNLKRRLPQSAQELGLREMCQQLYNMMSLSLLQSTLVELPATFLSNSSVTSGLSQPSAGNSIDSKGGGSSPSQDMGGLTMGTIKLCVPAANFSHIINTDDSEEDFASRLSSLVQNALLTQNVETRGSGQTAPPLQLLPSTSLTTSSTTSSPHFTHTLTGGSKTSPSLVVETMEESLSLSLPDVTRGLDRGSLGVVVKEEDLLSDGEAGPSEGALATTLDPPSPSAVSSHVILNDPILSVSGEPLAREEGLQATHHDTDISCTGLNED
ncbi:hypothetical protein Pcinc_029567 [Petrolisthes cinctipes]|uniref:Cyclin-D-binding Myb-like transcription factor 1 n=1 Tax=Petrolisthes cinctipes TaxID=88211 RepID=A0AAE1F0R1_PETCI|nr:hypothetical protein Pcinc_029567 [Petrolisthes cinctipes]